MMEFTQLFKGIILLIGNHCRSVNHYYRKPFCLLTFIKFANSLFLFNQLGVNNAASAG